MQGMRDMLRQTLRGGLRGLSPVDRLSAAWRIACGKAMAARGTVVDFREGVVYVEVTEAVWVGQMNAMRSVLQHDMARIAGVPVEGIHFQKKTQTEDGGR